LTLELSQLAGHVSHFQQFLGRHIAAVLGVLIGDHNYKRDVVRDVEMALTMTLGYKIDLISGEICERASVDSKYVWHSITF
jgi:hypothetical protein